MLNKVSLQAFRKQEKKTEDKEKKTAFHRRHYSGQQNTTTYSIIKKIDLGDSLINTEYDDFYSSNTKFNQVSPLNRSHQ